MDKSVKNKQIAETIRLTYTKRKNQICKTFKFKVDMSSLSREQKNQLKMQFVEAKWIYKYDIKLDERTFICPVCGETEDRDIHAANNMTYFYQTYKDRLGTSHTSKPVKKILFSEYAKQTSKQEDTILSGLC